LDVFLDKLKNPRDTLLSPFVVKELDDNADRETQMKQVEQEMSTMKDEQRELLLEQSRQALDADMPLEDVLRASIQIENKLKN